MSAALQLGEGEGELTVNGIQRGGVRTSLKDGKVCVPPSVVCSRVAADWGQEAEDTSAP